MIITFVGTNKGNNSAKKVAAAVGAMLSLSNNKKVCIIQISNDATGIEDFYNGKTISQASIGMKQFGFDDHGIDGIIRKADNMKLTKEHFHTACNCMLKSDNRLDILGNSKQKTFLDNIFIDGKTDSVRRVIQSADKLYNFVLVILPNREDIVEAFINEGDVNVCCVRQSEREEPFLTDKKNVMVITNFDPESVYTVKNITKEYKSEGVRLKTFPMIYNTQFRDAYHGQVLLKWILKNCHVNTTDINYDFITALQGLTDYISDTEAEETEEPVPKKRRKNRPTKKKEKRIHVDDPEPTEPEENNNEVSEIRD